MPSDGGKKQPGNLRTLNLRSLRKLQRNLQDHNDRKSETISNSGTDDNSTETAIDPGSNDETPVGQSSAHGSEYPGAEIAVAHRVESSYTAAAGPVVTVPLSAVATGQDVVTKHQRVSSPPRPPGGNNFVLPSSVRTFNLSFNTHTHSHANTTTHNVQSDSNKRHVSNSCRPPRKNSRRSADTAADDEHGGELVQDVQLQCLRKNPAPSGPGWSKSSLIPPGFTHCGCGLLLLIGITSAVGIVCLTMLAMSGAAWVKSLWDYYVLFGWLADVQAWIASATAPSAGSSWLWPWLWRPPWSASWPLGPSPKSSTATAEAAAATAAFTPADTTASPATGVTSSSSSSSSSVSTSIAYTASALLSLPSLSPLAVALVFANEQVRSIGRRLGRLAPSSGHGNADAAAADDDGDDEDENDADPHRVGLATAHNSRRLAARLRGLGSNKLWGQGIVREMECVHALLESMERERIAEVLDVSPGPGTGSPPSTMAASGAPSWWRRLWRALTYYVLGSNASSSAPSSSPHHSHAQSPWSSSCHSGRALLARRAAALETIVSDALALRRTALGRLDADREVLDAVEDEVTAWAREADEHAGYLDGLQLQLAAGSKAGGGVGRKKAADRGEGTAQAPTAEAAYEMRADLHDAQAVFEAVRSAVVLAGYGHGHGYGSGGHGPGSARQLLKEVDIPRLTEELRALSRVRRELETMKPACSSAWSSTDPRGKGTAGGGGRGGIIDDDDDEGNIAHEGYGGQNMVRQRLLEIERVLRKSARDLEARIVEKYMVPVE